MGQLLEAIADEANLAAAWTTVRMNAGAAGVDGQTIAAFTADEEHQLASLRRRLLSAERYVPPPVRRVEIPKPDGRVRPLGIPERVLVCEGGAGGRVTLPARLDRPGACSTSDIGSRSRVWRRWPS